MGAKRIPNATNEKIIALMSMGKTGEQTAFAVGVSASYCNKLYNVVKHIANEQWDELIEYSRSSTTGGVIAWACEYLDTQLPQEVAETIEAVNAITEAADDICQTVTTARKLNEDCINANFDVLTATLRYGIESVKTTIRKRRN